MGWVLLGWVNKNRPVSVSVVPTPMQQILAALISFTPQLQAARLTRSFVTPVISL